MTASAATTSRRQTLLRVALVALVALLAVASWFAWQAYGVYQDLHHITGVVLTPTRWEVHHPVSIPPLNGNQRFNILVLGSDNDQKVEEKRPLTQSMIVVTIDPVHYQVGMLSIPRDFWVPIPGHGYDKLDVAAKDGGFALTRATIERLFGIPIHHYAWVGLAGFRKVIDTFNGIDIDPSYPILDDFYPDDLHPYDPYAYTRIFIPPGWRHLSGRQALEYVRSRHADRLGDFGRSARQQQVLLRLRVKLTTMNVLTHLLSLVHDLHGYVQTDLSIMELRQLEQFSHHIKFSSIRRVVLLCTLQQTTYCNYGSKWQNGAWQSVLEPHWKNIYPVVRSMFAPIRPASAPSAVSKKGSVATRTGKSPPKTPGSPTPRPTPTATSTPTGVAAAPARLPGTLVLEKNGTIYRLSPSQKLIRVAPAWLTAAAMPAVSPDGRYVAFIRFAQYSTDLNVLDMRTGQVWQITHDRNRDVHNNLWAAYPTWSPDERTLLFSTDRAKLSRAESETRPLDLGVWSMSSTGKIGRQITIPQEGSGGDIDPQWRPHRRQFLFVQWHYNKANQPYSQLVLRDLRSGRQTWLTGADRRVLQPAWNAAGDRVVYVIGNGNSSQIVVAPLLGGRRGARLGPGRVVAQGIVAQPAFTPDGRWVSFLQADGDGFDLMIVPAAGGQATQIKAAGSDMDALSRPVWISR